jgi:hypothetical protein
LDQRKIRNLISPDYGPAMDIGLCYCGSLNGRLENHTDNGFAAHDVEVG